MTTRVEEATIEQLVSLFGFPSDRSRQAVAAIGDKSDVQLAYNWLLDHGEDDRGGPIEVKICEHADHASARFVNPEDFATVGAFEKMKCSVGCSSGEVWMCLSCGVVRCSRYVKGHNLAHFKQTMADEEAALTVAEAATGKVALGHFAAIGLQDLSVWCYLCSAYVTSPIFEDIKRQLEKVKFGKAEGGSETAASLQPAMIKGEEMRGVPWQSMHGFKGIPAWKAPTVITVCDEEARPGYRTKQAHEYLDDPETLATKVSLLAWWIRQAKAATVYSGAGISTAAGVDDYATKATDSVALTGGRQRVNPFKAEPTLSHCVITQLHFAGQMPHWIQQNHDGLPQKAGFPQQHINEIHGAWFDPSNPVVPMTGTLRDDLIEWLVEWEGKTDLCIAVGTSLCGMNADRVVVSAAQRAKHGIGFGSVIISLQQTQLDSSASLRIFAKSDDVFQLLAAKLNIPTIPRQLEEHLLPADDIFKCLPYSATTGRKSNDVELVLDLRVGRTVRVINQPIWDQQRKGNTGVVVGKTSDGDYMINFDGKVTRTLGRWWLIHALKGEIPSLPVVNA